MSDPIEVKIHIHKDDSVVRKVMERDFQKAAIYGSIENRVAVRGRVKAGNVFLVHRCTLRSLIKSWWKS